MYEHCRPLLTRKCDFGLRMVNALPFIMQKGRVSADDWLYQRHVKSHRELYACAVTALLRAVNPCETPQFVQWKQFKFPSRARAIGLFVCYRRDPRTLRFRWNLFTVWWGHSKKKLGLDFGIWSYQKLSSWMESISLRLFQACDKSNCSNASLNFIQDFISMLP